MSDAEIADRNVSIYEALQDHKEFWTSWIALRTMPMAETWLSKSEVEAAKALRSALEELNKVAEDLGLISVQEVSDV